MKAKSEQAYFPTQGELLEEIERRLLAYQGRPENELWAWKTGFAAGARWVAERSELPDRPGAVRLTKPWN
jgi:hypothetical protein